VDGGVRFALCRKPSPHTSRQAVEHPLHMVRAISATPRLRVERSKCDSDIDLDRQLVAEPSAT
jgi:hypothetical protein